MKSESRIKNSVVEFKVTDVTSHRNGVCGRRFYSVRFSFAQDGVFMPNMLAVMPDGEQHHPAGRDGIECFVLDLNNPHNCWRAESFAKDVSSAVKAYDAESEAKFRALMKPKAG